jgi:protein AATF/BFR2
MFSYINAVMRLLLGASYEVHEKLQNFMVPVPVTGVWHEEQIDELFSSLLGRGFEHSMGGEEDEDKQRAELEDEALKDGYRVFG